MIAASGRLEKHAPLAQVGNEEAYLSGLSVRMGLSQGSPLKLHTEKPVFIRLWDMNLHCMLNPGTT